MPCVYLRRARKTPKTQQALVICCIIYIETMLKTFDFLYKTITITCGHNYNSVLIIKFPCRYCV